MALGKNVRDERPGITPSSQNLSIQRDAQGCNCSCIPRLRAVIPIAEH
uniref:Uncharacterized protein n=2 Tax=unclassified Caudoviricetes TaxID=2788787 RepID=A0A8S5T717_9CAUD|nr:MAG TPA: hypothetical protein [Myoviridae sp. cta6i12]DAF91367.1 MAG TPA: hypothetical protein [Myoviridae sp. ctZYN8]DAJ78862.1 MAG TPA: hypothetical protein [Caudoviricetes sp.]